MSCARCHDHKFDPIPTQDYYSLAGIFSSSKLHNAPLCKPEDIEAYNTAQQKIKMLEEAVTKFLAAENSTAAESRVGEISRYMEAVWKYRVASAGGQPVSTAEFAKQTEVSEFLLKRWISFLDSKEKGKVGRTGCVVCFDSFRRQYRVSQRWAARAGCCAAGSRHQGRSRVSAAGSIVDRCP